MSTLSPSASSSRSGRALLSRWLAPFPLATAIGLGLALQAPVCFAVQRVAVFPDSSGAKLAADTLSSKIQEFHDVVLESGAAIQQALLPCKADATCALTRARALGLDLLVRVKSQEAAKGILMVEPTVIDVASGRVEVFKSDFWEGSNLDVAALHTAMRLFRPEQVVGAVQIDGPATGKVTIDGKAYGDKPYRMALPLLDERKEHEIVVHAPEGKAHTRLYVTFNQVTHLKPNFKTHALVESGKTALDRLDLAPLQDPTHPRTASSPPSKPAVSPPTTPAAVATAPAPSGGGAPMLRTLSYVAGGLGVVGMGAGVVLGLANHSAQSDYDASKSQVGDPAAVKRANDAAGKIHSTGVGADVAFAAGGALLATGVILYFFSDDAAPVQPAVGFSGRGATLGLAGSF